MKKILLIAALFVSTSANAWWGPGYGYGMMPGYGYGMGYGMMPYGLMGYGWGVPAPSFNYNTIIQQSPPIIINEQPPAPVYQQPVYPPKYTCPTNTCR